MEAAFELKVGGGSLKQEQKKFMKMKTNVYFIFKKYQQHAKCKINVS